MQYRLTSFGFPLVFSLIAFVQPVYSASTEQRLQRLERMVDNRILFDLLQRMDTMDAEIRELRGENERLSYELQSFRKRQDSLYQDTDSRLQRFEGGGVGASLSQNEGNVLPEKEQYDAAILMLKQRQYAQAVEALTRQLEAYPGGDLADNALYWRGEAYYVQRLFDQAIASLTRIENEFPSSSKLPDALLKQGYALYEKKDYAKAKQKLSKLVAEFPDSTAANLGHQRLERMASEGV